VTAKCKSIKKNSNKKYDIPSFRYQTNNDTSFWNYTGSGKDFLLLHVVTKIYAINHARKQSM
jgi:hypothetical protein